MGLANKVCNPTFRMALSEAKDYIRMLDDKDTLKFMQAVLTESAEGSNLSCAPGPHAPWTSLCELN